MKDPQKLYDLCLEAATNVAWVPEDGKTFCNFAADHVAHGMGCDDLRKDGQPLTADEIYQVFNTSKDWRVMTLGAPSVFATEGSLIFGIMNSKMLNQEHGHIATVLPGEPIWSGHWVAMAPICMNVGRDVFIGRPMSFAFRTIPTFFAWVPSL